MYGNAQLWNCIMIPLGVGLSCYTILPVFYRTGSDSVFYYIERRFGKLVSQLCLFSSMLSWMFYVAAAMLIPSLSIKTIIVDSNIKNYTDNISNSSSDASEVEQAGDYYLYIIIFVLSLICIFYTLVGGMKAVLWADTINGVALIATMITIAARLLYVVSFTDVIETCENSNCQSMGSSWLSATEHFDITYRNPPFYYAIRMFVDCIITLPLQQARDHIFTTKFLYNKIYYFRQVYSVRKIVANCGDYF